MIRRLSVAIVLAGFVTAFGTPAEAGCKPCPKGYSYWHSKEACVPKIEGFDGTPPASTWVEPLKLGYVSGTGEESDEKAGADR